MKAKDVARQINQAVLETNLQARWDACCDKLAQGQSPEQLGDEIRQVEKQVLEAIERPSRDYLGYLVETLGKTVAVGDIRKTASARAAVLAAEQAWRGFHSRLAPLPAKLVDPEGFRSSILKHAPAVAQMTWPTSVRSPPRA